MMLNPIIRSTIRKSGRNVGKKWGYVAGEGELEKYGQDPPGPKKGGKKFSKFIILKM